MGGRVHEWLDFMIKCRYRNKVLKSAKEFPIFQCLGLTKITVFHDANHRQQDSRSPNKRGNNEVVGGKSADFSFPLILDKAIWNAAKTKMPGNSL